MKLFVSIAFFLMALLQINAQEINQKTIVLSREIKTVPEGRRRILKSNQKLKIEISDGTLKSGTLCNASFLSNPSIAAGIYKGDYQSSVGYGIFFRELEKIPFSNINSYSILATSFFESSTLNQLEFRKPEEIGTSLLEFNAGETVFVGNCINAIEMIEEDLLSRNIDKFTSEPVNWDIKSILRMKGPSELITAFGQDNIKQVDFDGENSNTAEKTFQIFSNGMNALKVVFRKGGVANISTKNVGSKWKFPYGLNVGDSLEKVIRINNKDFEVYGFEWDYSGLLKSWNGGRLEKSNMSLSLATSPKSDQVLYAQLLKTQQDIIRQQRSEGKQGAGASTVIFNVSHPLLRRVGLVVDEISISND
jgi:hypothetical protein